MLFRSTGANNYPRIFLTRLIFKRAINARDSTSFRRLKKLAKEADDHERVLDFYAKEMRSAYWHTIKGTKLSLYYLYDWASDYGRSILRPFLGLLVSVVLFAMLYFSHATTIEPKFSEAVMFSGSHVLPIYPGVREFSSSGANLFFGEDLTPVPWWLPIATTSQYIVSSIFLFLILLALRNRFRT